ncbi:MAG: M1 family peptidase, partial [Brevundimonas sp.]
MRALPLVLLAAAAALAACASTPEQAATPTPPAELSTPFTLTTGSPRTPEQLAVRFDKVDLAIRVMPDSQSIDAVAVLDVTAMQPVDRLVFELDTRLP